MLSEIDLKISNKKLISLIGLPNYKVCEVIVEKLTELGVTEIIFFVAQKTEIKVLSENKIDRLNKIKDSALKQSKSIINTKISFIEDIKEILNKLENIDNFTKVVFSPDINSNYLSDISINDYILSVIGPENGLTEIEEEFLRKNNFNFISLGDNILRAETAAILGAGLLLEYGRKI